MVELKRDRKASHKYWLITTTDSEGFHRQLPISHDDIQAENRGPHRPQEYGSWPSPAPNMRLPRHYEAQC